MVDFAENLSIPLLQVSLLVCVIIESLNDDGKLLIIWDTNRVRVSMKS